MVLAREKRTGFQEYMSNMLRALPSLTVDPGLAKTGFPRMTAPRDDGDLKIGLPITGPRFTLFEDGTIYDNVTGLMWVENPNLLPAPFSIAGVQDELNWNDTIDACEGLIYAGHSDWRCPNINEIMSLFFINPTGQQIDLDFFKYIYNWYYWSSTTYFFNTTAAWITEFIYGLTYTAYKDTSECLVIPVRGGRINA